MAGFIKTLIALGLSILALIMPGAGKAEEAGILYPSNASPAHSDPGPAALRPSFRLCFQMPSIAGSGGSCRIDCKTGACQPGKM